jgi:sporulation protein YabP
MENPTTKSNLVLNNRNELNITGIKKVRSTEPNSVVANLDNGNVIINGSNLSVSRLDIKEGVLELNGTVDSIKYSNQSSKSFSLKNMFK